MEDDLEHDGAVAVAVVAEAVQDGVALDVRCREDPQEEDGKEGVLALDDFSECSGSP